MYYKIKVGISKRHVHLTKETYENLFDEPLTKRNDLNQIGEFASNQVVDIVSGEHIFENVRVVGPFRNYNQVEISKSDALELGLNPPVRSSGNLDGASPITIQTNKGKVFLNEVCIINERHVHFNTKDVEKYNIKDKDKIKLHLLGEKRGTIEAFAKVSDNGYLEAHLDTDDANSFLLQTGDEIILEIEDK